MKKIAMVVIIVLMTAFGANAQISFYGGGGINMPFGPEEFKDYMKMGNNFCGGVGFNVSPQFVIGGTIAFNKMGPDFDKLIEEFSALAEGEGIDLSGIEIDGFDTKAMELLGEAKFSFGGEESSMKPYLLGCFGITKLSLGGGTITVDGETFDSDTISTPEFRSVLDTSITKTTFGFGAGLDFVLSPKINFFVEARYMIIMVSDDDLDTGDAGVDPSVAGVSSDNIIHIPVRAGLRIFLGGGDGY